MLVLTVPNKKRVRLLLPDGREIWLTVDDARHSRARLLIDAPTDVRIEREEIIGKSEKSNNSDEK